jgi:hypothetical protein
MSTTAVQKLYDVCKATFSASSGVPSAAALERVRLALGMSYMYRVLWISPPPPHLFPLQLSFHCCVFVCLFVLSRVSLFWGFLLV